MGADRRDVTLDGLLRPKVPPYCTAVDGECGALHGSRLVLDRREVLSVLDALCSITAHEVVSVKFIFRPGLCSYCLVP